MIQDISHITFIVKDLNKTKEFFTKIFDAEVVYESHEKSHSIAPEFF